MSELKTYYLQYGKPCKCEAREYIDVYVHEDCKEITRVEAANFKLAKEALKGKHETKT